MKRLLLVLSILFASVAQAQTSSPIAYDDPASHTCLSGRSCSPVVDLNGRFRTATGTRDAGKIEGTVIQNAEVGYGMMCIKQNSSPTTQGGVQGAATFCAVNSFGDVYVDLNANHREGQGVSPLRKEDEAFDGTNGDAVLMQGIQRQDTPTNQTSADGDVQPQKGNSVGATYIEPANQIAVYTAEVAIAEATITNTYASALSNSAKLKSCIFNNATDGAISLDDSTNAIASAIPANTVYVVDWGANGRWMATTIRIKYVTNPSTGTFYINCYG